VSNLNQLRIFFVIAGLDPAIRAAAPNAPAHLLKRQLSMGYRVKPGGDERMMT